MFFISYLDFGNDFNNIMGANIFHYYSTYLDYVDGSYDDENLVSDMREWFDKINSTYIMKTEILDIIKRNKTQ